MLVNLNKLTTCQIEANDGKLGNIKDIYFDDKNWVIRFIEADTHAWLPLSKKVLLSPISILYIKQEIEIARVSMNKEMVKECPKPDAHQPVSREFEEIYFDYFGYHYYWAGTSLWGDHGEPSALIERNMVSAVEEKTSAKSKRENHLRSAQEVKHYDVIEQDAKKGQVIDFIFDSENWALKFIVLDTCSWLPTGKKVLITPEFVKNIRWSSGAITCNLSFEELENCPPYKPEQLNDKKYLASIQAQLAA